MLDAKYRSSCGAVLNAMSSAHLYHSSMRWKGRRPDCALLLIARGGAVPTLERSQYRRENVVDAVAVGDIDDATRLLRLLAEHWAATSSSQYAANHGRISDSLGCC